MPTPPFFAVQKQKIDGVVTLVATEYTLETADLDPQADFRVFADVFTILSGTFTLPGKNITIYARNIICPSGAAAVLDTSGVDDNSAVLPFNPPKADSGKGAGDAGQDGKHGGSTAETKAKDGQAGGNITINAISISGKLKLIAKGGRGQKGQQGQEGGDGIGGKPGENAIIDRVVHDRRHPDGWAITPATPGSNGGRAGNGGNAGKSGNGGKAGTVSVHTVTPLTSGQITSDTSGGKAGLPANPGKKGTPGKAGLGGLIAVERTTHGHFHRTVWELSKKEREPGAADGAAGRDGLPAEAAADGSSTAFTPKIIADVSSLLIYDECFLSQLVLAMTVAEIAYLERNFVEAADVYQWIGGITAKASGASGLDAEFAGLYQQCRALQAQIGQGLDFFGNPINYVPLVTLDYYQKQLDGMLATGYQIENVYNTYTAFLQDQTRGFTQMQNAIDRAKDAIDAYETTQTTLLNQINNLIPVINRLTDAQAAQYGVLLEADADFQRAAKEVHDKGCSWANLLTLVKTIVSVSLSTYNLYKATGFDKAGGPIKELLDLGIKADLGKVIEYPTPVNGSVPDIATAWTKINPSGGTDVSDSKKLILQQEEFDKAIKPYLDLTQALRYRTLVHDYVGLAQSRNAKLLEYTNALIQYLAITGKIARKQKEIQRIRTNIAAQNVPGLIPYRNFLFSLYQDFKAMCLKYLYQENRAYTYWSQTDNPFQIGDNSFTGLGQFHSRLKGSIIDRINTYSQPDQPIEDIKIVLTADGAGGRPDQFTEFEKTNALSFQISTDNDMFLGWANVLLTNFRIYIPGVEMSSKGNLYIQLWHHGRVFVIGPTGLQSDFTHGQVLSVYQYTMEGSVPVTVAGGALGGDGTGGNVQRIALSPYATFTVKLPPKFNPGLQLKNVKQVELHFSGYAVPRKDFKIRYA